MTKDKPMKSIWQAKKIAPLEYCSLNRAASLLGCEIEDFYHWYMIGAINFAIDVGFVTTRNMHFHSNSDFSSSIENNKWEYHVDTSISMFSMMGGNTEDYRKTVGGYSWKTTGAEIFGIWKIEQALRTNIKDSHYPIWDFRAIQKKEVDIKIKSAEIDGFIEVTNNSVLLIREDIEKIYTHSESGLSLPSYITGDIQPQRKDDAIKSNFSPTQTNVIYTLLQILYGEDVSKLSRDSIHDLITQDCAKKGIAPPSFTAKSLENWMKKALGKL
ncbi:hypothetical protein [Pectobacterium polaris]|uniref:Uncharacterized protein n=1 Tax=Pectobacterium polaris TaxID=2042057 RepID=A0AAW5GFG2_9GAMM|nr:hypothetical protein [Pectobacterium polaris]MCL6352187.1 hypothetical protein [Pectobacterium polaris]MCL6369585.1 hypothetical protein [Pectobacterium polaris]